MNQEQIGQAIVQLKEMYPDLSASRRADMVMNGKYKPSDDEPTLIMNGKRDWPIRGSIRP